MMMSWRVKSSSVTRSFQFLPLMLRRSTVSPCKDIACVFQSHDVCVVCKHLERNRIDVFSIIVLHKVQLDQLGALKRVSVDWIRSMFLDPGYDVGEIEYGTIGGADGMLEGLKRDSTEVEWQTFEACACYAGLASVCSC